MAPESVSACRKALANSGTMSAVSDAIPPRSGLAEKRAPRLIWARRTVRSSKANWGRNLSAMPIIIPSSCAGTPTRASGVSSRSKASVMSRVVVVSVSRLTPSSRSTRRTAMKAAWRRPASLTISGPHWR